MVVAVAMVVVVVSLAMTVVVLKVVVVKGVGLVKRAGVMWMVVSAAAKLEALLAAAEDRQVGACFLPPPTYETMK